MNFIKKNITPKKAKFEKWYVENKSLYLYFKLIILTLVVVLIPSIDISRFFNDI